MEKALTKKKLEEIQQIDHYRKTIMLFEKQILEIMKSW